MAEVFIGELRLMSFTFAPKGWALCNGQILSIAQNQALFSLLGTQYGGNGQTTFALPDLRGRAPMHQGPGVAQGTKFGTETVTLTLSEMPTHGHALRASSDPGNQPTLGTLASANNLYGPPNNVIGLDPTSVTLAGGGQPHENQQPHLVLSWCIATQGIFPSGF